MNTLKKNIIYSVSYQILVLVLPIITYPYISRVIGAEGVGIYSYSQSIVNYFIIFAMLGVSNYGNREVAIVREDKKFLSRRFSGIYYLQILMSITMSILYYTYILLCINEYKTIYIIQGINIITAIININWLYEGLEKFKFIVVRNICIRFISTFLVFIVVKDYEDLVLYTFIMSMTTFFSSLILWIGVNKKVKLIKIPIKEVFINLKPNIILFIPILAISLYNIMDIIMLGNYVPEAEVGFYTSAEKIVQIPVNIIAGLGTVMLPRICNLYAAGENDKISNILEKTLQFVMIIGVAFSFGLAAIAHVFTPWFYGEEFKRCGLFIMILSIIILFKSVANVTRTQYIIPTKKDKVYIFSVVLGAVINVILNLIFIPKYFGIGAILSTIIAELIVCMIQFIYVYKKYLWKNLKVDFIAYILNGIIMFFVIYRMCDINIFSEFILLIIQVAVGAIIYITLLFIYFKVIRKFLINESRKHN